MNVVVVIPTYNERDNLPLVARQLLALPLPLRILVVDDNSPDGTGALADDLAAQEPRLEVLHRAGKGGRGSACLAGFRRALDDAATSHVVEMDADLSHDPGELPGLLAMAETYDVVVASRYLPGSRIVNWGWQRRVFSRVANLYARGLLAIPIHDYTNGYRCYRRAALATLPLDEIRTSGYIVLSEMAYALFRQGRTFGEAPTVFVNRQRGKSNTNLNEIKQAFWGIWQIRSRYR
ncbi:MAG: polyprenol monophosphomannose synthase [Chloroflexi bacterium]|nr:polyprenol monophosphomannose synthase [Chloroflexota bacterium]